MELAERSQPNESHAWIWQNEANRARGSAGFGQNEANRARVSVELAERSQPSQSQRGVGRTKPTEPGSAWSWQNEANRKSEAEFGRTKPNGKRPCWDLAERSPAWAAPQERMAVDLCYERLIYIKDTTIYACIYIRYKCAWCRAWSNHPLRTG